MDGDDQGLRGIGGSQLALEPGDTVSIAVGSDSRLYRLTEIGEHNVRDIHAQSIDPDIFGTSLAQPDAVGWQRPCARPRDSV